MLKSARNRRLISLIFERIASENFRVVILMPWIGFDTLSYILLLTFALEKFWSHQNPRELPEEPDFFHQIPSATLTVNP